MESFSRPALGVPALGAKVAVHVRGGLVPVTFSTTVIIPEPQRELRWRGHFVTDRAVTGEHYFRDRAARDGRSRFIHGEQFTGRFASLAWRIIERDTRKGYALMNKAFQERCESRS